MPWSQRRVAARKSLAQECLLTWIESSLESRPPRRNSWKDKGVRLAKEKDYSKAIEAFMQHVVEEPESFFGFNAIAVCYKNLGDPSNAMKNFERAFEFTESPEERAKVLANIGNLYFSAGRSQVALDNYKEAASEFPKDPPVPYSDCQNLCGTRRSTSGPGRYWQQRKRFIKISKNTNVAKTRGWDRT